jgi:hypothetical protein
MPCVPPSSDCLYWGFDSPSLGDLRQALASENSYHPELATLLERLSLKSVNLFLLDKETRLWCVYISIVEVYCRNHE